MRLGVGSAVIGGEVVPGDVEVRAGRVDRVGISPGTGAAVAVPGFIDVHVHGHAGVDFVDASVEDHVRVSQQLPGTGVTAYNPTLMSMPMDHLVDALGRKPERAGHGARILGFHLEGPFLSPEKPGAHRPTALVEPTPDRLARLASAGPVDHITLAPELPGGLAAIELLTSRQTVVSLGHSTADAELAIAAIQAGATAVTHIFNAMPPLHHRRPGLAGVALTHPAVWVTGIFDGVHLADEVARMVLATAADRVVAITDGTAAVAHPGGPIVLGDIPVEIVDGAPRLPDGTLAGSILTMDQAFRNLVALGLDVAAAATATATAPARLARVDGLGTLRVGAPADIVVLDDRLEVTRTLVAGGEVFRR